MKTVIKTLLREALLKKEDDNIEIINNFIDFCKEFLEFNDDVKFVLAFERTPELVTTAYYNPSEKLVAVYCKDRAIIDICRSIAHELVHHKQNLEGRLKDTVADGSDGSPIENEANSVAGVIIRKYGKLYPEIYI